MISAEKLQKIKNACLAKLPVSAFHKKDCITINSDKAKLILYKKINSIICVPRNDGRGFDYRVELLDYNGKSVITTDADDIEF